MPAMDFANDAALYGKALSELLHLENSSYTTRPTQVLVVDRRQLNSLAAKDLIPKEQLEQFKQRGLLAANGSDRD